LSDDGKGRSGKDNKKDDELGQVGGSDYIEKPEMLRFGNARVDAPSNRACKSGIGPNMILGTIEEDKAETQTSNYQDGMSEREDSKLFGSAQLRGSNILQESDLMDEQISKGGSPGPCRSIKLNNSSGKS